MCDFNPVHYLFATGTSEVSIYICVCLRKCFCVCVKYSAENIRCFCRDLVPPQEQHGSCCKV